tara:strand:- start:86 stop:757 length:672 start_codon:yes stop_codon:yes gene_type:complete
VSQSIEVTVCSGILCADFNEGRLVIDTGSPVSLGPDMTVQILGNVIQLSSSFGSYTWASIQQSLPFEAIGLIGVDAFTDSTLGFDVGNQTLAQIDAEITGNSEAFIMGSPVIGCQIGEEKLRCLLDTGAGLSYLRDFQITVSGQALGKRKDFHPLLGQFDVETVACSVIVGQHLITEVFGIVTESLMPLMESAQIDGILGTSFFEKGVIEIDFSNEVVGAIFH